MEINLTWTQKTATTLKSNELTFNNLVFNCSVSDQLKKRAKKVILTIREKNNDPDARILSQTINKRYDSIEEAKEAASVQIQIELDKYYVKPEEEA